MNPKHSRIVPLVGLAALVVSLIVVGTATGSPGYTQQGLTADGLRWQGLARMYQRQESRPAASFYTPQALKAEGQRWQAMAVAYQARQSASTGSTAGGFDWADAGIGAAGGLGFAIVGAALLLGARRVRRTKVVL